MKLVKKIGKWHVYQVIGIISHNYFVATHNCWFPLEAGTLKDLENKIYEGMRKRGEIME